MNNTFSIKRFNFLLRYHWAENKKNYIIIWITLILILLVLSFIAEVRTDMVMWFIFVFSIAGSLISIPGFIHWDNFSRSSLLLLLPVTITEKFICTLFYGLVLYIPAYLITYLLARYALMDLILLIFSTNGHSLSCLIKAIIKELSYFKFEFYIFALMTLLFIQSISMMTFLWFRRRQFFYSLLFIVGTFFIYNLCSQYLLPLMTHINGGIVKGPGGLPYNLNMFGYTIYPGNQLILHPNEELFFVIKVIRYVNDLVWMIIFGMIYTVAWYKFKEREI